jgi:hypothetical protein
VLLAAPAPSNAAKEHEDPRDGSLEFAFPEDQLWEAWRNQHLNLSLGGRWAQWSVHGATWHDACAEPHDANSCTPLPDAGVEVSWSPYRLPWLHLFGAVMLSNVGVRVGDKGSLGVTFMSGVRLDLPRL